MSEMQEIHSNNNGDTRGQNGEVDTWGYVGETPGVELRAGAEPLHGVYPTNVRGKLGYLGVYRGGRRMAYLSVDTRVEEGLTHRCGYKLYSGKYLRWEIFAFLGMLQQKVDASVMLGIHLALVGGSSTSVWEHPPEVRDVKLIELLSIPIEISHREALTRVLSSLRAGTA